MWGEPYFWFIIPFGPIISTHSPRVGRTLWQFCELDSEFDFNSLAPCGANLNSGKLFPFVLIFQLTRPVWGEPASRMTDIAGEIISTHSPRVGRTSGRIVYSRRAIDFNSLAPCGANRFFMDLLGLFYLFQLTRPVWGEPIEVKQFVRGMRISTHSPRVGRTRRR